MAYGTPTDPVAGTVITVSYFVSNALNPIRQLRLNTGNAEPPGSNYVVVSDSTSGTTWRKIPTDAIADGAVTDVKLGTPKVSRAGDTMTNNLTFSSNGTGLVLSSSGTVRDFANAGDGNPATAISAAGDRLIIFNQAVSGSPLATIGAATASFINAISAVSITVSGAIQGAALTILGNAGITGTLNVGGQVTTGEDIDSTGYIHAGTDLSGTYVTSTRATAAGPPLVVASEALVANLNAEQLQGRQPGTAAGDIAYYDAGGMVAAAVTASTATTATTANNANNLGGSPASAYQAAGAYQPQGSAEGVQSGGLGLSTSPSDIPGCSVSLPAGTWQIIGRVNVTLSATSGVPSLRLSDSAATDYDTANAPPGTSTTPAILVVMDHVVIASTTTFKLRGSVSAVGAGGSWFNGKIMAHRVA